MNSFELSFVFCILLTQTESFGRCDDISFSICWMSNDNAVERQNGNLWLNTTSLKSIITEGKLTSITVSPAVENKLTLQYGGSVKTWTLTISPRTKYTRIRGMEKPRKQPTNTTQSLLDLSPNGVFACEKSLLFFHQDDNFFLAFGHSMRLPVKLESRTPSMLLVSWVDSRPAVAISHTVTLYYTELGSYNMLSTDTTTNNHYEFTALDSCSPYVPCVEIAGTHPFLTCLSTITDPDVPRDFEISSWNSSSISLVWDCPENCKFSLFLLTAFYLNGTDHVTEEVLLWHKSERFVSTLSDLQPCSRVKFGLQTVCQAGMESRYSKMILNDGNSGHSSIEALRQTSLGPDNYTLSWKVKNTSSIATFRVYHEGTLQGTTLINNYTLTGLLPCSHYQAKVEAVCGDGVLMNAQTLTAHTGPRGVSQLRYRSNDSTVSWSPGTALETGDAYLYELSLENGTVLYVSNITETELHLPGLEEGKTYVLDVWEECDGQWESEHTHLCFTANSSTGILIRAAGHDLDPETLFDISNMGLTMVVPWSVPEDLQDNLSEPRANMGRIVQNKLQELLIGFDQPVRVELATFEPAFEPDKTEFLLMSFDASEKTEDSVPLLAVDQMDYIRSLNTTDITVRDGVIHWSGPDLCASSTQTLCPRHSMCINTLGSYTCVCQHGYYDVSSHLQLPESSAPICNEKGIFSQCLNKVMTGGIAKPYLTSYIGGKVDVTLNDGRCTADEDEIFYLFRTSRKASECGTEMRVNKTHIEFQNTFTVTLTKEQAISRRDLKVVWKCVYPLHYIRNAHVSMDMEWFSSLSLVEFNSSLQLVLTMNLYSNESYSHSYRDAITLGLDDTLYFQVDLQANNSFASDVLLQVESCWATESTDPQDEVQGVFLQDGCPVDDTFLWASANRLAQRSRFSIQMFHMPSSLPLYFHCLANICEHKEECTKNCTSQRRTKRTVNRMDTRRQVAVVSAGPLVVSKVASAVQPSSWSEHMMMISIVVGLIGVLGLTVLAVSATKATMTYYEQLRQK